MEKLLERNRSRILGDYFELLRFQSVGADPSRLGDCANCAAWIKNHIEKIPGFKAELFTSPRFPSAPPIVLAERPGEPGSPSMLFYGHYDVQPEDPVEAWETPPFEPVLKGGRVYCRGAQDDKGQWFAFLEGVRALVEEGKKLPTVKIILEGQEESGSTAVSALAGELAPRLRADVLAVCDTHAAADGRPSIVAGLRGVASCTVTLSGPAYDLHSGTHGGLAPNPAQGIAELAASLHDADGRIAVEGFYDEVSAPSAEELEAARADAIGEEAYARETGCRPVGGQAGLGMVERNSFMPTVEVNGIHGGYGGPGAKTVIPASAFMKLSMRLVPDQRAERTMDLLRAHLEKHVPRGMKMEISDVRPGAPGFRLPLSSPVFALARRVLAQIDPRGAGFQWDGASIPVVSVLAKATGAAPLLAGFGREEDHIHSPNESYGLDQFECAMEWGYCLTAALAAESR